MNSVITMVEKQKKRRRIYEGSFLDVYEDDVILPSNQMAKRVCIHHPGGAGILAVTHDQKIVLVKQYRYAVGDVVLEIPAGKIDHHDDPLSTAKRELAEETGYTSDDLTLLCSFYPTPGYSNEKISLYFAKDVYLLDEQVDGDDDEFIVVDTYSLEEVKRLMKQNKIVDAKTIIAINYYLNRKENQ